MPGPARLAGAWPLSAPGSLGGLQPLPCCSGSQLPAVRAFLVPYPCPWDTSHPASLLPPTPCGPRVALASSPLTVSGQGSAQGGAHSGPHRVSRWRGRPGGRFGRPWEWRPGLPPGLGDGRCGHFPLLQGASPGVLAAPWQSLRSGELGPVPCCVILTDGQLRPTSRLFELQEPSGLARGPSIPAATRYSQIKGVASHHSPHSCGSPTL